MKQSLHSFGSFFRKHRLEFLCYAVFIGLAILGFCVHEPAYDEAQAWMIAKTASLHDIIFVLPLHEGHPPFWHLLLAVPAKLGVSWHVAASMLGLCFMLVNGFLLFFKAPFPRWIRCCLPFSYFLFFQYGLFVRPYAPMTTLLLLLAIYFPQKDKRPSLFITLLALLCMCHLFGIAIAGGIVLAWLWEIKNGQTWKNYLFNLCKDARFHKMLILLLWTLLLLVILFDSSSSAIQAIKIASPLRQIIYVFLAMPAETVLTNLDNSVHITETLLPWRGLIGTACVGLILWTLVFLFLPRTKILYLILPYLCLGSIMIFYSSCHHIGVVLLLFIWYFWINLSQGPISSHRPIYLRKAGFVLLLLAIIIPMGWTAHVLYLDYKINLLDGKKMVNFLKKYNLMDELVFSAWTMVAEQGSIYRTNVNRQPASVWLNLYLPYNIIDNFHNGENKGYMENFCPDNRHSGMILRSWTNKGKPMVLIDPAPIAYLFLDPQLTQQYHAALLIKEYRLWKFDSPEITPHAIYLHESLWEKYKDQIISEATPPQFPQNISTVRVDFH